MGKCFCRCKVDNKKSFGSQFVSKPDMNLDIFGLFLCHYCDEKGKTAYGIISDRKNTVLRSQCSVRSKKWKSGKFKIDISYE